MPFRYPLLTVLFLYAGGLCLCQLQCVGLLPTESLADLAPFPATTMTQAPSGQVQLSVTDTTTGQTYRADTPPLWWISQQPA